jgi:predicted ATPase
MPAPYLQHLFLRANESTCWEEYPMTLPFVPELSLKFTKPVTFFVGENGSGKSTLMEALAELCGFPVGGGGKNDISDSQSPHRTSELAPALRASFRQKPRDGYFFRAEFQAHFASMLETRKADPDFVGDPYGRYGGRSLHTRSHGEAFLAMFGSWLKPGLILMDEPEAALSPQRQLALLVQMDQLAKRKDVQMVIATHSPLLLTFPGATLISFDDGPLKEVRYQDTSHYQITKGLLDNPERYWHHLLHSEEA